MNTLITARAALVAAEQTHTEAKKKLDSALAAQQDLRLQATSDGPRPDDIQFQLMRAESDVATAQATVGRAARALAEERNRHARLEPHAAVIQRLDKALAAVAAKDEAISAACQEFYSRLVNEVRDLGAVIASAEEVWRALPVDVRTIDVGFPADRASQLEPGRHRG